MFQRLLTADLVIADLSIHNANVFYELGIRHSLREKRTFMVKSAGDSYPFDLQTDRYFTYDRDDPKKSLPDLIKALKHTLASTDQDSTLIALWNGKTGDGPGGTADLVDQAGQRGAKVVILDTKELFGINLQN
jgi:hypothetical protein